MKKLAYTFTNDILFKMLFVKYPDLLKRLVAELLGIKYESIEQFEITNPEIPLETIGDKFCRLDINMIVNGQRIDLEIQVHTELNYQAGDCCPIFFRQQQSPIKIVRFTTGQKNFHLLLPKAATTANFRVP